MVNPVNDSIIQIHNMQNFFKWSETQSFLKQVKQCFKQMIIYLTSFGPATMTLKYLAFSSSGLALIPGTGS